MLVTQPVHAHDHRIVPSAERGLWERLTRVLLAVQVDSPGNAALVHDELCAIHIAGERLARPLLIATAASAIAAARSWLAGTEPMEARLAILRHIRALQRALHDGPPSAA